MRFLLLLAGSLSFFSLLHGQPKIVVSPQSLEANFHDGILEPSPSFIIQNTGTDTLRCSLSSASIVADSDRYYILVLEQLQKHADSLVRGTVLHAKRDFNLTGFTFFFSGGKAPIPMEFFIFEGDSNLITYRKVFSRIRAMDFSEYMNASSGPIDFHVVTGKYYILGVSWGQQLSYGDGDTGLSLGSWPDDLFTFVGELIVPATFPSLSSYPSVNISTEQKLQSLGVTVAFPLEVHFLQDTIQNVPPGKATNIAFTLLGTPPQWRPEELNYVYIRSNAPVDSSIQVSVHSRTLVGVQSLMEYVPETPKLAQNYPNPFNPSTEIRFEISHASHVTIQVYNVLGQIVATLEQGIVEPGMHTTTFDGSGLSSGIYLYRIDVISIADPSSHFSQTRKMSLVR